MPRIIRNELPDSKQWERGSVADVWARLRQPDQLATYLAIASAIGLKLDTQSFGPEHDDWRKPNFTPRRTDITWAREQIARHVAELDILLSARVPATVLLPEPRVKTYDQLITINTNSWPPAMDDDYSPVNDIDQLADVDVDVDWDWVDTSEYHQADVDKEATLPTPGHRSSAGSTPRIKKKRTCRRALWYE